MAEPLPHWPRPRPAFLPSAAGCGGTRATGKHHAAAGGRNRRCRTPHSVYESRNRPCADERRWYRAERPPPPEPARAPHGEVRTFGVHPPRGRWRDGWRAAPLRDSYGSQSTPAPCRTATRTGMRRPRWSQGLRDSGLRIATPLPGRSPANATSTDRQTTPGQCRAARLESRAAGSLPAVGAPAAAAPRRGLRESQTPAAARRLAPKAALRDSRSKSAALLLPSLAAEEEAGCIAGAACSSRCARGPLRAGIFRRPADAAPGAATHHPATWGTEWRLRPPPGGD